MRSASSELCDTAQDEDARGTGSTGFRASEATDSALEKALADIGAHAPGHQAIEALQQRASRSASHNKPAPMLFASAAEGEGSASVDRWMVSYADFITLMFVFFLALYTLLPKETHEELLGRVVPHDQPQAASQVAPPASQLIGAPELLLSEIEEALAPLIDSGDVRARRVPRGVQVEIRDTALFEVGTADINQRARNIVAQVARIFVSRPNLLQVEGHTDPSPIQSALYPSNWELSAARASRVVRLLQEYGVRASRLSAVGMADTKPVGDNATAEGRSRNRRVAIIVVAP
ncbi:OmpA family protein [Azohydromonas caseinilytica]|uniref:OmpA family protein n=1 Tax=Azohydromonas caseinilytica TaxID=2728836 RepID=A0A848F7I8_9BURK|nr:OmpA family protein [Azohydromonas caseinilytica]NML14313.1 OmpA family protein [Azohydromonas caseinilytica]